jgi:hypothetical protein
MSFEGNILRVLIASPGDVPDERDLLWDVMSQWSGQNGEEHRMVLLPVRWEFDATPEVGDRPQAIIEVESLRGELGAGPDVQPALPGFLSGAD